MLETRNMLMTSTMYWEMKISHPSLRFSNAFFIADSRRSADVLSVLLERELKGVAKGTLGASVGSDTR